MGLRSGLILCFALNKTEPGVVAKLVGIRVDSVTIPDGPPLSSSPCYENITNFLLAIEEMGLPTFEGSDLEHVKVN
ncbi:putative minus-end-directed kinesin ATPase [Helianthus annuus]|nr:putative minus-end-directed kinesin ATPase [Helianthus annuus]